jgi:methylated-DNA-[protein]-cysteine S-methyltransferase
MTKFSRTYYESPIGLIELVGTDSALTSLIFVEQPLDVPTSHPYLDQVIGQLDQYFKGERRTFDLNLGFEGTPFQKQVWNQLLTIPYGQTASYLDIAKALGDAKATRAVGAANGSNPISIIVPCHRIIGSNGKLTGYGGGLWRKEWLLKHEGSLLF